MLNDATCFKNIFIVTGYTDLRFGLDSLAAIIESKLGKSSIYLPWQELPFLLNFLVLCGFPDDKQIFYNKFTTFEKRSDMMKME